MKAFCTAAMAALTVFAGAAPAFAGGPWDGGYAPPGLPPGAYAQSDGYAPGCDCPPPPPPPCDCVPVRYEEAVGLPTEFFEGSGGVGPDAYMLDTGGGGGGEIIENASASASASASVSVSVRAIIHAHQRMHFQPHGCGCGGGGKKW
jgi:hypothetical protein